MGREIRRIPKDWEHPRDAKGHYLPLYNQDYETALANWQKEKTEWESPENAEERARVATDYDCHTFEEWHGEAPDLDSYRPAFTDEATHYQIYENVTEGTPMSPVFASLDEMVVWLIAEGYTETAARKFSKTGYAPSFVYSPGYGVSGLGIHSLDFISQEIE